MFGFMTRQGQIWLLTLLNGLSMTFSFNEVIWAAKSQNEMKEPLWVISWAVFFLFLGVTIYLLAKPTKRLDSILTEEEEKDYEEQLGIKRSALIKEEVDQFEDD